MPALLPSPQGCRESYRTRLRTNVVCEFAPEQLDAVRREMSVGDRADDLYLIVEVADDGEVAAP